MDPACPTEAARTVPSSCSAEAVYKEGGPPGFVIKTPAIGNDLLLKRVPERVVTPLSYSLLDLACPVVVVQDSCSLVPAGDLHMGVLSDPVGDVYMGGTIPPVNNAPPAMVPLVGGFFQMRYCFLV
jgi:hypothetical protein